jgi:hypothetical protein
LALKSRSVKLNLTFALASTINQATDPQSPWKNTRWLEYHQHCLALMHVSTLAAPPSTLIPRYLVFVNIVPVDVKHFNSGTFQ